MDWPPISGYTDTRKEKVIFFLYNLPMSKQKSHKSATKRFHITKTGKVMRRVAFGRHLRRKKSASQLRTYRNTKQVTGKIARRIKRLMAKA